MESRSFECDCDKSCDIGQYLDYKICKYRKKLVDELIEKLMKRNYIKIKFKSKWLWKICSSCIVYITLFVIFFTKSISISSVFIYFHWYLKRKYIEKQSIECNFVMEHINGKY